MSKWCEMTLSKNVTGYQTVKKRISSAFYNLKM